MNALHNLAESTEVQVYSSFDDLPVVYQTLFHACSRHAGFFMSYPWFRHLSSTGMNAQIQLRIYVAQVVHDQITVYAILPMCHDIRDSSIFRARVLRAVANYYTAQYAPLLEVSVGPEIQLALLTMLAQRISLEHPAWDMIDLHPMHQNSDAYPLVLQAFSQAGMSVNNYFCAGNWSMQMNRRNYRQYYDGLPSRLRHTLTRKAVQLNKSRRLRMEIITSETDAQNQIGTFLRIYERSWKHREPFPEFIPGWILESARQQWLRLGIAYIDDQPAAAQIWLVEQKNAQKKASIYKLAHDEQFDHTSIGSLLTEHLMRHVIDIDQVDEVDFLHGDEKYKQDWMSQRSEYRGMIAYSRKTLKGRIAYGIQKAVRGIKRFKSSYRWIYEAV